MAYQYDDAGQPINLSNSEINFKKLWRNIDALDLPHLNPQMAVDSPSFDPSLFFQKLSWAQAELGVVMDVVDGVLAGQSLRVQTISHHGEEKNHSNTRATNTEEYVNLAVDIFEKAKNDMPDTSTEIEDLRKLVALRQSGWPVLRLGLNWFVNYSHASVLNLPLDMGRLVPLKGGQVEEILSEHLKLLEISCGTSSISISAKLLMGSDNKLAIGLLSSLDSAIYAMIREKKRNSISEGPDSSIVLSPSGVCFKLVSAEALGVNGDDRSLLALALKLYESFIESRGKDIDL